MELIGLVGLGWRLSPSEITLAIGAVLIPAGLIAFALGRGQRDRALINYAGYALAIWATFAMQAWVGRPTGEHNLKGISGDFMQLPYAWFYLRFVRAYFKVEQWSPRWSRFYRRLEWAYVLPLALLVMRLVTGWDVASWVILVLNLTNLIASYMLAMRSWLQRREGSGWFIIGVLPLVLAGLLLAVQWAVEPGGSNINGLLPFWLGVVLQLILFMAALAVRRRRTMTGPDSLA